MLNIYINSNSSGFGGSVQSSVSHIAQAADSVPNQQCGLPELPMHQVLSFS